MAFVIALFFQIICTAIFYGSTYPNPHKNNIISCRPLWRICLELNIDFAKIDCPFLQVYFAPDEVHAAIVTCGGLCPGLNTVIREIVCALYHMYGVTKVLGIDVSLFYYIIPGLNP